MVNIVTKLVSKSLLDIALMVLSASLVLSMLSRTMDRQVDYATRVITVLSVRKLLVQVVHISPMTVIVFVIHAQLVTIVMTQMVQQNHNNVQISIIVLKELKLQLFAQMVTMHPVSWLVLKQQLSVLLAQQVSIVSAVH